LLSLARWLLLDAVAAAGSGGFLFSPSLFLSFSLSLFLSFGSIAAASAAAAI
jgi:hypothetical protein